MLAEELALTERAVVELKARWLLGDVDVDRGSRE
jgi:hypothetical protein